MHSIDNTLTLSKCTQHHYAIDAEEPILHISRSSNAWPPMMGSLLLSHDKRDLPAMDQNKNLMCCVCVDVKCTAKHVSLPPLPDYSEDHIRVRSPFDPLPRPSFIDCSAQHNKKTQSLLQTIEINFIGNNNDRQPPSETRSENEKL